MVCSRQFVLATAFLAGSGLAQNITGDNYFYGQSPPVYPTPQGTGTGDWADAYAKAAALVAQMTLEEKNNLTFGATGTTGCSGSIGAIERLGFPGLCLQDAGNGVRGTDFVSGFPSGLHVGASWNKSLTYDRAYYMGGEFRAKGVNIALGPVVGPLGRVVTGGRNWEGISNDPYLCGSLGAETVKGIQDQGVITSLKHYIANEQEAYRNPTTSTSNQTVASVSSNIDDKTMHEAYLWPFADAIKAGTGNIMCSYNRLNNSYACSNSKSLNGYLKTELGYQGFVVTDWQALHSGVGSALAGLDMAMPSGGNFWGVNFTQAYTNGSVPLSRLDDMATRIIAAWYKMGQDSGYPALGVGMPKNLSLPHVPVDARDPKSRPTIFQGAVEGHVLVKNDGALPLKSPKLITVYGYSARAADLNIPVTTGTNLWSSGYTPDLLETTASSLKTVDLPPQFMIARNGTLFSGGGSGANTGSYLSAPLDALQQRAYQDGSSLLWDLTDTPGATGYEGYTDACLVFINAWAQEGYDRPGLHDDYSDDLVNRVADTCNNTIVVIHNAGTRLVDQFVDHPNVTGIIFAHLPGQDSGPALTSLLYGDSVFSGKLPYTIAKNESDYENVLYHDEPVAPFNLFPQSNFTEGVYLDYRNFDAKNITPRYEFGFGLSYTTFSFSNLAISKVSNASFAAYPTGEIQQGGQVDLWDTIVTVAADVTNTGGYDGAEVAQLYVGIPGGPIRQLRGFDKIFVTKGETGTVKFDLTRRDLSTWDVAAQSWNLQTGSYPIYVGSSSRILPLTGTLSI